MEEVRGAWRECAGSGRSAREGLDRMVRWCEMLSKCGERGGISLKVVSYRKLETSTVKKYTDFAR